MRVEAFASSEQSFQEFEMQYESEISYFKQSLAWKSGMRFRYSPETYLVSPDKLNRMQMVGGIVGSYLGKKRSGQVFEFRIDFVESEEDGLLYVTEVQTDDRGLPAVTLVRNARGKDDTLSGVVGPFCEELVARTGSSQAKLLITYPKNEEFYYRGFQDFSRFCWAESENVEILVFPRDEVSVLSSNKVAITIPYQGTRLIYYPELVWDFSGDPLTDCRMVQPKVTKSLLSDMQKEQLDSIKPFVPEIRKPDNDVADNKDYWVLKPIDGRWSKGVIFGSRTTQLDWEQAVLEPGIIAQRFVPPATDLFYLRLGPYKYALERMYSRVEGYYVYNSRNNSWLLADVLATCTKDIPVHGKRDCIMIPGKVTGIV